MCFNSLYLRYNAVESSEATAVPEQCSDPLRTLDVLGQKQNATAKIRSDKLVCGSTRCGVPVHDSVYAASDGRLVYEQPAVCR
jgi:hypothetical protein